MKTISLLPAATMERASAAKDPSFDGLFYVAVRTTGVFCRPSCPARAKPENVEFFANPRECIDAGYRPCLRCRPLESNGVPPEWVARVMSRLKATPDQPIKADDLRQLGVTPERARRWFKDHYGMSFAAWSRSYRLGGAYQQIREGAGLDEAGLEAGFESHSGFREAFGRLVGNTPRRANGGLIVTAIVESPLGPMLAGVNDGGVCNLEFADRRSLTRQLADLQRRFKCAAVPGSHRHMDCLRQELTEYFAGERKEFTVPLVLKGTDFQEKVWRALCQISWGQTIAYEELARRIGQPTAQRAVALANGMNRLCILVPCHRVIGKDGSLTGYGGGLWRKRLLLRLEQLGPSD